MMPYLSGYSGWQGLSSLSVADINLDKLSRSLSWAALDTYPNGGTPDSPRNYFF